MTTTQNTASKNLVRLCSVCGKKLVIIVFQNKIYRGGHFFGKIELGKAKKAEYWECDPCYKT